MSGYDCRNKCVFSFLRNVVSDGADWTSAGRLFQSRGPAAAKERSPTVTSLDKTKLQFRDRTNLQINGTRSLSKFSVSDSLDLSPVQFTPPTRTRQRQSCLVRVGVVNYRH